MKYTLLTVLLFSQVAAGSVTESNTISRLEKRSGSRVIYKRKCQKKAYKTASIASIPEPEPQSQPQVAPVAQPLPPKPAPAPVAKPAQYQQVKPKAEPQQNYGSSFIQTCLQKHNNERAQLGLAPLLWDNQLANNAKKWSNHLAATRSSLVHSSGTGEGENLYWSKGSYPESDDAICSKGIQAFIDERSLYEQEGSPAISAYNYHGFGHYTQLAWKGTQRVGCAVENAADNGQYLTCRYFPAGNVIGQRPY